MSSTTTFQSRARPTPAPVLLLVVHAAVLALFVFQPRYSAAALAFAAAVAAGLRSPKSLAFVALGLLWVNDVIADWMPFSQATAWKDLILVIASVAAIGTAVVRRQELIPRQRLMTPLLVVVFLYLLMCAYSPSLVQALLGLKNTIFYSLWVLVLPLVIRTKRDARTLIIALFVSMAVLGLYNLWRVQLPLGAFPTRRDGRILPGWNQVHWSGSPYLIAPGLLLGMAVLPAFAGWRKWLLLLSMTVGAAGLLVAGARATTGTVLVSLLLIGAIGGRMLQTVKMVLVGLAAAVALEAAFPINLSERATSAFDTQDVSRTARERETTAVTVPYVLTHPFGEGTGTMAALYSSGGVWSSKGMDFAVQGGTIHNTFLMIAIEVGWLGAILWAWFLASCLRAAYACHRTARDPFVANLALGLFAVVAQYAMMHFFAPMLSAALISFGIWLLIGLLPVLPALERADAGEPAAGAGLAHP